MFWLPLASMLFAIFLQLSLASNPATTVSAIVTCGAVIWAAATMKTTVSAKLSSIEKQLTAVVTKDALERRLLEERLANQGYFVTRDEALNHVLGKHKSS